MQNFVASLRSRVSSFKEGHGSNYTHSYEDTGRAHFEDHQPYDDLTLEQERESYDGEGGGRRSKRQRSDFLHAQDDQVGPTPSDASNQVDRQGILGEVLRPRDRSPPAPPAGTASTSKRTISVGDRSQHKSLPAGKKDSCRSRTSSSQR